MRMVVRTPSEKPFPALGKAPPEKPTLASLRCMLRGLEAMGMLSVIAYVGIT